MVSPDPAHVLFSQQSTESRLRPSRMGGQPMPITLTDPPDLKRDGDEFMFLWAQHGIGIGINQLREMAGGIEGEITVNHSVTGPLHWARLNLASTSAREILVKKLARLQPEIDWTRPLEHVCRVTAQLFREGKPVVELMPAAPGALTGARYLVEKLLPLGETSGLYADGGNGKSYLGLSVALAVATGTPLPCGLRPTRRANVLILDWESVREEHAERLGLLAAGLGIEEITGIFYREMARPLVEDIARIRAEVSKHEIGLVVVDSFGPAAGIGPQDADATIPLMNALRSLSPASRLVITHVSKSMVDQRSGSRPYGSVFFFNLCRSLWEIRRSEEDTDDTVAVLGLFHRKANRGKLHTPIGLRMEFGLDAVRLKAHDVADRTDLLAKTTIAYRIQKALAQGAREIEKLAEAVEASPESVGRILRRLRDKGKVVLVDEDGRGKGRRWGLAAQP